MFEPHKLLEIREKLGMKQEELARAIGYSRELVNKVEGGKMKASRWFVKAVEDLVEQHRFVENSHDVNNLGKTSFSPSGEAYLATRLKEKNEPKQLMVPLVGIKAQAGYVKGYEQVDYIDTLEQYSLPPGVNATGAVWRYFEIDGDSMEPTFSASDIVLATMVPQEDWRDIRDDNVYIIHTTDQLLIKRLQKVSDREWLLLSDNEEAYPKVLLNVEEVRQLWLFRRHIRSVAPKPGTVKKKAVEPPKKKEPSLTLF